MNRAVAMSAASVICLALAGGCASTSGTTSEAAAKSTPATPSKAHADAGSDAETADANLPASLDGEIRRAQLLRTKGDYDEATRSLAQLMLFAPDDARVVGEYGKVLEQQGLSKEALSYLKRAVELQPHDWSLHSALGVAYDQLDDHASARLAYERALSLKPAEGSVLNNYAVSRMLAGDYAAARRLFSQAAAAGSPNPKFALNLDKLAELSAPAPANPAPAKPAPMASAPTPAERNHMPLPVAVQTAPPPKPTMQHAVKSPAAVATAAPKPLGTQVVMQRVPIDPLAGPVTGRTPAKLAAAKKPKPVAPKPADATPSLRTAADSN